MEDDDALVGEGGAGVIGGHDGIVPLLDLAEEAVGRGLGAEMHAGAAELEQVVGGDKGAERHGDVQGGATHGIAHLLLGH